MNGLKIRVKKKNALYSLSVFIFVLFAFSYGSFGVLIPFRIWLILLSLALFCMVLVQVLEIGGLSIKLGVTDILLFIMLLTMLFWNNHDYAYSAWYLEVYMSLIFIFFLFANMKNATSLWFHTAITFILLICLFHAVSTVFSYISRSFYMDIIYPIVDRASVYSLVSQYNQGYMAGFTSHYSTNGIFLSVGLCVIFGYYFFQGDSKIVIKFRYWIILAIMLVALLLTGKRGPVIYIAFSFVVVYYVYNSNKKLSRYFKMIAIAVITLLLVYILSFFIPGLTNIVERFIEQSAAGDVTTGRMDLWGHGIAGFLKHPIFGNGWCWFRYNNPFGKEFHTHNVYIQWLCEVGIVGSISFFAFTFILYRRTYILLKALRLNIISLNQHATRLISVSLMYQTFFIALSFAGTAFYEVQSLFPYIFCCIITEHYWKMSVIEKNQKS